MKEFVFLGGLLLLTITLTGCSSTTETNTASTAEETAVAEETTKPTQEELSDQIEAEIQELQVDKETAEQIRSITIGTTTETTAEETAPVEEAPVVEETTSTEGTTTETSAETPTEEPVAEEKSSPAGITMADVATHDSSSDCWLVIDGGVYDVTSYISSHPGGSAILRGCGIDATSIFSGHPASADAIKANYKIGDLAQ